MANYPPPQNPKRKREKSKENGESCQNLKAQSLSSHHHKSRRPVIRTMFHLLKSLTVDKWVLNVLCSHEFPSEIREHKISIINYELLLLIINQE